MSRTLLDSSLLEGVKPDDLAAHLQATGWQQDRPFYESATIWLKPIEGGADLEILLPLKPDWVDYPVRVREALQTLEIAEKRPQIEILGDLIATVSAIALQGIVAQLNATAIAGAAILTATLFGKLQPVRLDLDATTYKLAIAAYRARIPVTCQGNLSRQNHTFILRNLSRFELYSAQWQPPPRLSTSKKAENRPLKTAKL